MKLDIGCGNTKREGWVRLDKRADVEPDIIWDIEDVPWYNVDLYLSPIKPDSYEEILMSHVIEHVKPWNQITVMDECWRILIPNGLLRISTPAGGSWRWWQDPTHCCGWNEMTPNYFTPAKEEVYKIYRPKPWILESMVRSNIGDFFISMRTIKEE